MSEVPVRHPNGAVGRQVDIQVQSTKSGLKGR